MITRKKTKQLHVWCEDSGKFISDKTRHFRSEIHLQQNQRGNISQDNGMLSTSGMRRASGVEIIVNEKTNVKV